MDKNRLNEKLLKEASGGDDIPYKVMFGTTAMLKLTFKLFMIANHTPNLKSDGGTVNRNRLLAFSSQFKKDQVKDDFENKIFKQNRDFRTLMINKYKNAFVHVILQHCHNENEVIPKDFQESTDELNNISL